MPTEYFSSYDGKEVMAKVATGGREIAPNLLPINRSNMTILSVVNNSLVWDDGDPVTIDINVPPVPPPAYEYLLLQNFVDGESIGNVQDPPGWITTMPASEDCAYEYYISDTTAHLVGTYGDTLIDDRTPLDFTKYGITTGTPYGMVTQNTDLYDGLQIDLADGDFSTPFTFEFFTFGRDSMDNMADRNIIRIGRINHQESGSWVQDWSIMLTVNTNSNYLMLGIFNSQDGIDEPSGVLCKLNEESGEFIGSGKSLASWLGDWHHFAITRDDSNLYFFIDGIKYMALALSTVKNMTVAGNTYSGTLGNLIDGLYPTVIIKTENYAWNLSFDGGFAQVAVCNACKWTDDFDVPTEAY